MSKATTRTLQLVALTFILAIGSNATAAKPVASTQLHAQRIGTTVVLRRTAKPKVQKKMVKVDSTVKIKNFGSTAAFVKHILGS